MRPLLVLCRSGPIRVSLSYLSPFDLSSSSPGAYERGPRHDVRATRPPISHHFPLRLGNDPRREAKSRLLPTRDPLPLSLSFWPKITSMFTADNRAPRIPLCRLVGKAISQARPPPSLPNLSRPPLHKLLQVTPRRDPQHEPAALVRDDGELLPLAPRGGALEEGLELLERRVHRDDHVLLPLLALEPVHGARDRVLGLHFPLVQQGLQRRDGDVPQQGAGLGVDDGQVGVVALEGGDEGEGDGVGRVEGEGGGGLEVFYCGL